MKKKTQRRRKRLKQPPRKKKARKAPFHHYLTPFVYIDNEEIQNGQRNNIYHTNNNSYQELSIYPAQAETEADNQIPAEPVSIDTIDNDANNKEIPMDSLKFDLQTSKDPACEPQTCKIYTSENDAVGITKETASDKIDLSDLISQHPDKEAKISELYDIVCDVLTTDDADKIRVAKS
jgi:hypothetical protein